MATVKTIVLAGGMSRRMGQDKARIEIAGVPLLTQVCHVGLSISDGVYVVAGDDRDYADLIPEGCEFVVDRVLEGPLVALSSGVSWPQTWGESEWVLVLACDLPRLSVAAVKAWVGRLDDLPDETIAYLPKSEQGWEPLCGFYRAQVLPVLNPFVATGGRSFQRWLSQESIAPFVRELVWDDRDVFLNCNRPEDLTDL